MRQFALSDAARVKLNSELAHHKSRQLFAATTAFVLAPLGAAEGSNFVPLIALVDKLRLAHQELPPSERSQFRPIAAIGKLRPPRQNPRPGKAAELLQN